MGKNLVRKTFNGVSQSWTAPGGVNRVRVNVYGIPSQQFVSFGATGALDIYGAPLMWGDGANGVLGDASVADQSSPVATPGLSLRQLEIGSSTQAYGLTPQGQIYSWGFNNGGLLGDNTTTNKSTPVLVVGDHIWRKVRAGANLAIALKPTGEAYGWGNSTDGSIGDGNNVPRSSPVAVSGGLFFSDISCGTDNGFGIEADTNLGFSWGNNVTGALGDNSTANKSTPVAISGGLSWKQLEGGFLLSCGLTTDGLAYTWGNNTTSELGNGTSTDQSTPVAVLGGRIFSKISCRQEHFLGLTTGGEVYGWGDNSQGQLGNDSITSVTSPILLSGFGSNAIDIMAGNDTSFVINYDGTILASGDNGQGQLGDGTTTDRSSPVAVLGFADGTIFGTHRIQRIPKTLVATGDLDVIPGTAYPIVTFGPTVYFGTIPIYTDGSGALKTEVELEYFA